MSKSAKDFIITLPNQNLRRSSIKVGFITNEIIQIIDKMKQATLDWEDSRDFEIGVALAAIQINQNYRIVVVREEPDNKENRNFIVFINPTITKLEGKMIEDYEGCLSVKDVYGKVPRYEKVRVKAMDEKGRFFRMSLSGFLARVMQHEIDHTNGVLFVDRIKDKKSAFYRLDDKGQLEKLDYDKQIKDSDILW